MADDSLFALCPSRNTSKHIALWPPTPTDAWAPTERDDAWHSSSSSSRSTTRLLASNSAAELLLSTRDYLRSACDADMSVVPSHAARDTPDRVLIVVACHERLAFTVETMLMTLMARSEASIRRRSVVIRLLHCDGTIDALGDLYATLAFAASVQLLVAPASLPNSDERAILLGGSARNIGSVIAGLERHARAIGASMRPLRPYRPTGHRGDAEALSSFGRIDDTLQLQQQQSLRPQCIAERSFENRPHPNEYLSSIMPDPTIALSLTQANSTRHCWTPEAPPPAFTPIGNYLSTTTHETMATALDALAACDNVASGTAQLDRAGGVGAYSCPSTTRVTYRKPAPRRLERSESIVSQPNSLAIATSGMQCCPAVPVRAMRSQSLVFASEAEALHALLNVLKGLPGCVTVMFIDYHYGRSTWNVLTPNCIAGSIIGTRGANVNRIRQQSRAGVIVQANASAINHSSTTSASARLVVITGTLDECAEAFQLIARLVVDKCRLLNWPLDAGRANIVCHLAR